MPNETVVPTAGEPEWTSAITDAQLDMVLGGLLVPSQGLAKAMARELLTARKERPSGLNA